jgi:hypothetical protein
MSSNPDEIYRQQAASEPVAPATLRLYPDLKFIAGARQRSVLAEAVRKVRGHWTSYAVRFGVLAVVLANFWEIHANRTDLRSVLNLAFILIMFAWPILHFLRTRRELSSARKSMVARVDA